MGMTFILELKDKDRHHFVFENIPRFGPQGVHIQVRGTSRGSHETKFSCTKNFFWNVLVVLIDGFRD